MVPTILTWEGPFCGGASQVYQYNVTALRPLRGTKRRPGLGRVVNVYSKQISRKPENQTI